MKKNNVLKTIALLTLSNSLFIGNVLAQPMLNNEQNGNTNDKTNFKVIPIQQPKKEKELENYEVSPKNEKDNNSLQKTDEDLSKTKYKQDLNKINLMKSNLLNLFPKFEFIVEPEQIANNLFIIYLDGVMTIVTTEVDFMLAGGTILDTTSLSDITIDSLLRRYQTIFEDLPKEKAVSETYGDGSQSLIMFIDPDCQFCRNFERTLLVNKGSLNLTIHKFLITADYENPNNNAARILCHESPNTALEEYMAKNNKNILNGVATDCERSKDVSYITQLALTYQIAQTPTFLFENNKTFAGSISVDNLKKYLSKIKTEKQ